LFLQTIFRYFQNAILSCFALDHEGWKKISDWFYNRKSDSFQVKYLNLLQHLEPILTKTINDISTNKKDDLNAFPTQHGTPNTFPSNVPNSGFEGIIGNSHLLHNVFDNTSQVLQSIHQCLFWAKAVQVKKGFANSIHQLLK
jgi:transcriptional regulator with GAF, ATPase, and Fis domain